MKILATLLFAGKLGKFLITGGTMLLSVFAYALFFGWRYAVGLVILIFIHEMGHFMAARQCGLKVGAPTFIPFLGAWIETVEDLREIWTWSLERALGIYGIVSGGYPPQFYYCKAKPLSDGRVIVQTPAEKNRLKGEGYSRNFDDPVIPDWAVEISANEYADLSELPTYTGAQTSPAV